MSPTSSVQFVAPRTGVSLSVDSNQRTIEGPLLPWGAEASNADGTWRFTSGSLSWSDVSHVKLNREHDPYALVGVATSIDAGENDLRGSFRVARGDDGDRVLSLAEDGVLDGFSVEVEFARDGVSVGDDGVYEVSNGTLRGVAITASPAFSDARVDTVTASKEGTTTMGDQTDSGLSDAVERFAQAAETQVQQQREMLDEIAASRTASEPPTAQFGVNEGPLYRFDGHRGAQDFSSDIIAGGKGDHEAMARVQDFVAQQFAVETGDVGSLNPDKAKPDMWVDQLDYSTPLWDAMSDGSISDNTPFVLPKFDEDSDLVSDHTEGEEPDTGSFKTTKQTITPEALSGKVEITRETWDQGGNPQLSSILWKHMQRRYAEAREIKCAKLLDDSDADSIDVEGEDKELVESVQKALADLWFERGGQRLKDLKLDKDLFKALSTAVDDNGAPLLPIIGASNRIGEGNSDFGSLMIGDVLGVPSWALHDEAGDSYLFNREDVHAWASSPQRLQFEYRVAHVDIGIWGYVATAITRDEGVRKMSYSSGD